MTIKILMNIVETCMVMMSTKELKISIEKCVTATMTIKVQCTKEMPQVVMQLELVFTITARDKKKKHLLSRSLC